MTARIAVLIVAWNGKQDLKLCLSSLQTTLRDSPVYDVCVVDNASRDGTADWLSVQHPAVQLIRSETNLGFAGGNNLGLKSLLEQGYEYILLLNQDTVAGNDFLAPLAACLDAHPEISMVQPLILQFQHPNLINTDGNPIHFLGFGYAGNCDLPLEVVEPGYRERECIPIPAASGAAVLIRSELLNRIGLFDDFFFSYNEDLDLCWRARLAGTGLALCPRARVYHNYDYQRPTGQKTSLLERNRLAALCKNYRLGSLLLLSPVLLLFEIYMLLYAARHGWLGLKLRGYRELAGQKPPLRQKRRQVQALRRVSDRQIVRWFTAELKFERVNGPIISLGNWVLIFVWTIARLFIFW